jgi:hypothetical protein
VAVTEVVADIGRTTIAPTMTKVKRQITITVEDVIETYTDVVMEAEESSAIYYQKFRHYASDCRSKSAGQVRQSNFAEASIQDDLTLILARKEVEE